MSKSTSKSTFTFSLSQAGSNGSDGRPSYGFSQDALQDTAA